MTSRCPHTGVEVGVVPSHFTGGGPLFLLRPPAHHFCGLIGNENRGYFLICSAR